MIKYTNISQSVLAEFRSAYATSLSDVEKHWTREMQIEIAKHCKSWSPEYFDFIAYLKASRVRYENVIDMLGGIECIDNLCDVGGFLGVFSLALAKLGVKVAMTESLKYYSSAFAPLFEMLTKNNVEIFDYDPFESKPDILSHRFQVVTVLAVLEHYPHSPAKLMNHIKQMLSSQGKIVIEVPNIAYWPKRIGLLRGQSPLAPLSAKLASNIPFIGHHHEYSINDLNTLLCHSELHSCVFRSFNYSSAQFSLLNRFISEPSLTIATWLLPNTRECLAVVASIEHDK